MDKGEAVERVGSVLAAIDLGAGSAPVIRHAASLARAAGSELIALHVISPDEQEDRSSTPGDSGFVDVMISDTEQTLRDMVEASAPGKVALRCIARVGEPVDEILKVAADTDSLIVVGMRRRSRVGKFLLGSDLQELLLSSTRPIVAVPINPDGT